MSEKLKHVEIVAPVYNRRETTLQCLRSLSRIDMTGLKVHVIIVDDGSSDGTSEAIREKFPEVEIVPGDGTLHYTGATNLGLEAALKKNPDYVLAINDDSIYDEQFLQRMIRCAEEYPRSVIGALLLLWDRPHQVFQIGAHWHTWYGGWRQRLELTAFTVPQQPFEVEIIVGNCVLYPIQAIREVGLMNVKKFPYGLGDIEYTPRMRRAGWKLLIDPRARVWCQPNNVPAPHIKLGPKKLLNALFVDYEHQFNLQRQFEMRWLSAPSRAKAVTAFGIMLVRLGLKVTGFGSWPNWPDKEMSGKRS